MKAIQKKEVESEHQSPTVKNPDHMMYIRLPYSISQRLKRQSRRLSCSMNMLTRMAVVKYLEEEENKEHKNQS